MVVPVRYAREHMKPNGAPDRHAYADNKEKERENGEREGERDGKYDHNKNNSNNIMTNEGVLHTDDHSNISNNYNNHSNEYNTSSSPRRTNAATATPGRSGVVHAYGEAPLSHSSPH